MAAVTPIVADPNLPALRKLEKVVRDKVRQLTASKLEPIRSTVIRQGIEEGIITTGWPEERARVVVYLVQGYQQLAIEQFLARQAGRITFDVVKQTYAAFTEVFERILGIPMGSVALVGRVDPAFLVWMKRRKT